MFMEPGSNQNLIDSLLTLRASAVLEAAGAWDPAPVEVPCVGMEAITFYISYTRGGAAGAVDFQVEYSPYSADVAGVEDWFTMSIYGAAAVGAGADTTSLLQRELITYTPTAALIENFVYGATGLKNTVERLRVRCRESGNAGAPGTAHIVALFGV